MRFGQGLGPAGGWWKFQSLFSHIECWWNNESCTAKVKIEESSPDFQKIKKRKERSQQAYQMRIARKEEKEKKKKKGLAAAEAFKFRK